MFVTSRIKLRADGPWQHLRPGDNVDLNLYTPSGWTVIDLDEHGWAVLGPACPDCGQPMSRAERPIAGVGPFALKVPDGLVCNDATCTNVAHYPPAEGP